MPFNISRQPLVPAFITLAALAVAAVCNFGTVETGRTSGLQSDQAFFAENNSGIGPTTDPAAWSPGSESGQSDTNAYTAGTTVTPTDLAEHQSKIRHSTSSQQTPPEQPSHPSDRNPDFGPETPGTDSSTDGITDGAVRHPGIGAEAAQAAIDSHANPAVAVSDTITKPGSPPDAHGIRPPKTTTPPAIRMPWELFLQFQTNFPGWSKFLAGFLILFAGMCTGRMTVRYNLYGVGSCLAIPLYAIVACGLPTGNNYLAAFTASALLALAVKNYGRAFCNGYGFDAIFRASAYLGLLVLVLPAALPLLLILSLAILLFGRTLRETAVAAAGLVLPDFIVCYINWGFGGNFIAPAISLWGGFHTGTPLGLFMQTPMSALVLLGVIALLCLFSVFMFLSNIYIVGTKPRLLLIYNIGVLLITGAALCGPSAATGLYSLLAVPAAILLPVLFVRIHRYLALSIYLLLCAAALLEIVLQ